MENKESPNGWVAVSFAALIGLAAELFALALRRAQRIAKGELVQDPAVGRRAGERHGLKHGKDDPRNEKSRRTPANMLYAARVGL
jgi:hypothetical protein